MATNGTDCQCDDCEWRGNQVDLDDIDALRFGETLNDGSGGVTILPAGECPDCGAFVYLDCQASHWQAAQHAPELLAQLEALAVQIEAAGLIVPPKVRATIAAAKREG